MRLLALALVLVAGCSGVKRDDSTVVNASVTTSGPAPHRHAAVVGVDWKPLHYVDGRPRANGHACSSLTFGLDANGSADPQFERDAKDAARKVSAASGIPFLYVGHVPWRTPGVDITIKWGDHNEFPFNDALAATEVDGTGGAMLLGKWVHRDPGYGPSDWGTIILHELAHVVGLADVDDPTSIMSGLGYDLSDADRAGLWALGRGSCG